MFFCFYTMWSRSFCCHKFQFHIVKFIIIIKVLDKKSYFFFGSLLQLRGLPQLRSIKLDPHNVRMEFSCTSTQLPCAGGCLSFVAVCHSCVYSSQQQIGIHLSDPVKQKIERSTLILCSH